MDVDANDSEALRIQVTITDVDLALPESARYTVRSRTFARWSASMEIEGVIVAPDGSTVLAEFNDQLDDEEIAVSIKSSMSVFSDLAQLANRSSSRIARAIGELNAN